MNQIERMYEASGLDLILTCSACPEQYDVYKDGQQVAYYRLRHGYFRVDFPECGGETIYDSHPNGDGSFDDDERLTEMTKAMDALLEKLNNS